MFEKNNNITVFLEVYNEEERLESCLKSFRWAQKLIVFVKTSEDRTRQIAEKYATEIYDVPYSEASENIVSNISSKIETEWCFFITASSLVHPLLVKEVIRLTTDKNFSFDVIGLPYAMYSLGICSKYSPFGQKYKRALIRCSAVKLTNKIHREIGHVGNNIYDIPWLGSDIVFYHLTHESVDSQLARAVRYLNYEVKTETHLSTREAFSSLLKSLTVVLLRRRTFVLGSDGLALACSILTYNMLRYLYIWESKKNKSVKSVYAEIRKKIDTEFNKT